MDLTTLLQKLKPILGEATTSQAWERLQLADSKTAKLIEFSLRKKLAQTTGHSFEEGDLLLEPISRTNSKGPFFLGTIYYGKIPHHLFALRPDELIQHTAIFGRSGAGKTNVAFNLLREFSSQSVPFLVFDWKKNYRDLLPHSKFQKLLVYTVGRDQAPFFFNPLIPPKGPHPREWLKKLIEIMQHAYFLGEGVAFVLQEALDSLYQEFGIYDGSENWPSFNDLLIKLRAKTVKGREAGWMESALRAVGVLCFGAMDIVLNSGAHFPIETHLLKQQAVLELDAITNSDKVFLIEALLLWIHHYRMQEPGREKLKHVLMIEEAHHILLRKKQELTGAEAVTDIILREIREFGEGIILLDQLPSLISKPALENTYTTICMNLKEKGDVTAASKAMLLEPNEAKHLGRLPVGWAITKLQARWPKPFLLRLPLFKIKKGIISDQQVKERYLKQIDIETAAKIMRDNTKALIRQFTESGIKAFTIPEIHNELRQVDLEFLKDVGDHPISPVTERYTRLNLNPKEGTKLVNSLVLKGLLNSFNIPIHGSHIRMLELTPSGNNAINKIPSKTDRFGGPEHRFWVETIVAKLTKSGYQAKREYPIGNGKSVDILVSVGDKRIGIEVETGKSDFKSNIRKCLESGIDKVLVAPTRSSVYTNFINQLPKKYKNSKVLVVHPSEAIKYLY